MTTEIELQLLISQIGLRAKCETNEGVLTSVGVKLCEMNVRVILYGDEFGRIQANSIEKFD